MPKIDENVEKGLYIAGWCVLGVIFLVGLILYASEMSLSRLFGPCLFHSLTGLWCPGCGGTRAVSALLEGRILHSFAYQPFVTYVAIVGMWFMVSQTIERLSKGRIKIAMRFRERYLWIGLALIIGNFLIKNLALLIWRVDLMAF